MAMMARAGLIWLGALILGIILAVVGYGMTPAASFVFPGPINETGQSLIAIGFAILVVAVSFLLAGIKERMMAMEAEFGH